MLPHTPTLLSPESLYDPGEFGMEPLLTTLLLTTLAMVALCHAAMVLSTAIDRQKTRQLVAIKARTTRQGKNR